MIHEGTKLLLCVSALLAASGRAYAHRLEAQCFILPGWRVQVESWYETGQAPHGAVVQVYRTDGEMLIEGNVNKHGVFVFPFDQVEPLKVTVTSVGHRAEVIISAETLRRAVVGYCVAGITSCSPAFITVAALAPKSSVVADLGETQQFNKPLAEHKSAFPIIGVLTGVGILLVVALVFKWLAIRAPADPSAKRS